MSRDNSPNTVALFYPQWQGAGYSPELFDGTVALWNFFSPQIPSIAVPVGRQGELTKQNTIVGFVQIEEQLLTAHTLLQNLNPTRIMTIGGGCDVEVAVVSYLRTIHGPLGILWFDAISSKDVALLGVRDLDPPEKEYIEKTGIPVIPVSEVIESFPEKLVSQFRQFEKVYVHIDLDVLDPVEFAGVKCPTVNGVRIKQLSSVLQDIMERWDVIGLSLVENIEIDEKKLNVLEPLIQLAREL